jgi:hypothetical protein
MISLINISPLSYTLNQGGRWSSGKYVGTTCLRAAGSSPAPPAVWVFWRLIWRTESLGRGLILVCRFSFVRPALVYKVGCTCVTLYCSQMGKRLSQRTSGKNPSCVGSICRFPPHPPHPTQPLSYVCNYYQI